MQWSKLPTNLITSDLSDAEILAIVKYQLVFSLTEIEPSDKILNKFLTKKQKNIAKNFIADIKTRVENDLKSTQKKRDKNKAYYNNTKGFEDLSEKNSDGLKVDCQTTQTRLDKTRLDKTRQDNKEKYIKESFDLFWLSCPRQEDEMKTFSQFTYLINEKEATADELIEGMKRYKTYTVRAGTDIRFIKTPCNWLRDRSWENKYEIKEVENETRYCYNPNA